MMKLKHTPWLIQRAKFVSELHPNSQEHYKTKKGIDSILKFDYMGSSEFEWGALPKSLTRIRENKDRYGLVCNYSYKGKPVTLYMPMNEDGSFDHREIDQYLEHIETKQLKEWAGFDNYITPEPHFSTLIVDFWWDIDNDIMFWKTNKEFTQQFLSVV
jgi:hypothetical protein